MVKTVYYLFREIRPRQWVKNLSIFAAIFFTGQFLNLPLLQISFLAFVTFCLASSSIYIINDLTDLERDKLHPFKKNRPLVSGKISKNLALTVALSFGLVAFYLGTQISLAFVLILLGFYLLHLAYSFYLKDIMLLDILTIASGFILRVFAGEIATGYHIDIWLLLTVISGALFLAIGKRRSELTLLSGWSGSIPAKTRATLSHYSEKMLDVYLSMFANSTWITYAFYTFLQRPPILRRTFSTLIAANDLLFLQDRKFLMVTIPVVIYGVMRYLQLIYEKNEGESPEKVLLSDRPMIITGLILGLMLFGIIYVIGR